MEKDMEKYREFLKDKIRLAINFSQTDQNVGIEAPPIEKPYKKDGRIMTLPPFSSLLDSDRTLLLTAIKNRKSHRIFLPEPLSVIEVSYLLWATQGIRKKAGNTVLRTVPSAGNRHAVETYILVTNIEGLEPGVYRYLPLEHGLLFEFPQDDLPHKIADATLGQRFIGTAPVVFVWTAVPYRMEWRYSYAAHKVIALDAGHICQNLYLACTAVGSGTCAVAAYHQELMDNLIRVDGKDEFTIYLAPVGKVKQ